VNADMFYRTEHQVIYRHIEALMQKYKRVDAIAVITSLQATQETELVPVDYIHAIAKIANSFINDTMYAEQIKELYLSRQAIQLSYSLIDDCYNQKNHIHELINNHTNELIKYSRVENNNVCDKMHMMNIINTLKNNDDDDIIKFNKQKLDEKFEGGLKRGEMMILGAKTNMGKTFVAVDLFNNMLLTNNCIFFSLEMTNKEIVQRIYKNLTAEDAKKMTAGGHDDLIDAFSQRKNMRIIDDSRLTLNKIKSYILDFKLKYDTLDVIFIDYLQIMTREAKVNEYDFLCTMTRELKLLAKEFNVAIVLLSQLNRAGADRKEKRPTTADLRGSGSIEQDADIILFIHREGYYDEEIGAVVPPCVQNIVELICAKSRRTKKFKIIYEMNVEQCRLNALNDMHIKNYAIHIQNQKENNS